MKRLAKKTLSRIGKSTTGRSSRKITTNGSRASKSQIAKATPLHLKKILVPVDFSESSRKAIQYAVVFAKQFEAEILLLHVVDATSLVVTDSLGGVIPVNMDNYSGPAVKQLEEWRSEIDASIKVHTLVCSGNPAHEITRAASKDTDLIIIGRHEHGALARFFMGSTAEQAQRHAPCPTLVVWEQEHDFVSTENTNFAT